MDIERRVAAHYRRPDLEKIILDALLKSGKDIDHIVAADLSGADEFHLGWRTATVELAKSLDFAEGESVVDIGAGVGGPARYFAEAHGVRVTGIDLSADYIAAANALTRRCGLADLAVFQVANALHMPFPDAIFDGAYTVHAAMNIADKGKMFAEVRRVVKPGARFGLYDIMRAKDDEIPYPMPWAETAETSFVEPPATYRRLLEASGFTIESETDRRDLACELAQAMREKSAKEGPPSLGLHILMGPATPERLGNVMKAFDAGIISPVEIVARAIRKEA